MSKRKSSKRSRQHLPADPEEDRITTIARLVPWLALKLEGLERKIDDLLDQGETPKNAESVESTHLVDGITRALLLSGQGDRFDPVVRKTIADFRAVREALARLRAVHGLSGADREDACSYFEVAAADLRAQLVQLGVSIEEIPVGEKLDRTRFKIISDRETEKRRLVDTVAECVHPRCTWQSGFGTESSVPADVIVYQAATSGNGDGPVFEEAEGSEGCGNRR